MNLEAEQRTDLDKELLVLFGRMDAKLDSVLDWVQRQELDIQADKNRISALERARARDIGIALGLSFAVSSAVSIIGALGAAKVFG